MSYFFDDVERSVGNVLYMRNGTIWATYLLTGTNIPVYDEAGIIEAQNENNRLFVALSRLQKLTNDFVVFAPKGRTQETELVDRIIKSIPEGSPALDPERSEDLRRNCTAFEEQIREGKGEHKRLYVLGMQIPISESLLDTLLARLGIFGAHQLVSERRVGEIEKKYRDALPPSFAPRRLHRGHLDFLFDRVTLRGIRAPHLPGDGEASMIPGPRNWPSIVVEKNANALSLFEQLLARAKEVVEDLPLEKERRLRRGVWRKLRENYPSVLEGTTMSVATPSRSAPGFPAGPRSYQTHLLVTRYPVQDGFKLNSFTYLVDQAIGVDADFALRFSYNKKAITVEGQRETLRDLGSEQTANARDGFDALAYGNRESEVYQLHGAVNQEIGSVGMEVAVIYSFADQNLARLEEKVAEVREKLEANGFQVDCPPGKQVELWKAMLPGSPCPQVVNDAKQLTTSRLFSAYIPIRRVEAGDKYGVPMFVNMENDLGQIVFRNVFAATDKGSGSLDATGAKRAGKSQLMKNLFAWVVDLGGTAWAIDQHGEWLVFGSSIRNTVILDVYSGEVSLDLLKTLDDEEAGTIFMDVWAPMLDLDDIPGGRTLLSWLTSWEYRGPRRIDSTRKLLDHLRLFHDPAAVALRDALLNYARHPLMRSFIDPIGPDGLVQDLPVFNPDSKSVVFRLNGPPPYRGSAFANAPMREKIATFAYSAIGEFAAQTFHNTRGSCGLWLDEASFVNGSNTVARIVEREDRMGAKDANYMVVGSQLAKHLKGLFDLTESHVVMRQPKRDNAIGALQWGEVPVTERILTRIMTETSPPDPLRDDRTMPGREGECWYNDGRRIVRARALDLPLPERREHADTTASRMKRADDVLAALRASGQHAKESA